VQAKADLLVMENLFYSQKPTKTFDLKGIQGRKVKASSNSSGSKTLFDSEWIEGQFDITFLLCRPGVDTASFAAGQQRALTLVNPISKAIFQEATKADCDFLSRSNIMDYSYDIALPACLSPSFTHERGFSQAAARN
jgi:1-phosphatidylinositol-3-phosphate 5-kinase